MTVGEYLKKIREEKNLSLEQAAKETRIRLHYLEALEDDNWEIIPSMTQGRGFLRLYAVFLGIDPVFITNVFDGKAVFETPKVEEETAVIRQPELLTSEEFEEPVEPLPKKKKRIFSLRRKEQTPEAAEILPAPVAAVIKPASKTSDAMFKEIGSTLRKQRESLGLTLNDIEQYTHVRLHYLQAIEEGSMERLPSPVQTRGMLQNYAQFLDLDAEKILLTFADALQAQLAEKEVKPLPEKPTKKPASSPPPVLRRFLSPDLMIGGFLIIALVIFAVWMTRQVINTRNQQATETIPDVSEILLATPTVDMNNQEVALLTSTSTPSTLQNGFENNTTEIIPTGTLPPISNAPIQVYVVAKLRTYMKVTVDGKVEFEGRIIPGNAYPFYGNNQIELVTGNAAAIQVFYNQADLGTIGALGQSAQLNFTAAGILTPTPLFTLTASPTMQPTETMVPTATILVPTPSITPLIP